jgi:dynamin-like GTPase MGM1, mitochondrial
MWSCSRSFTTTLVSFLLILCKSRLLTLKFKFPRELDNRLGRHLSKEQIEAFAREDPKVRKHIELQQRKELLELALEKMESLMALEKSKKQPTANEGSARAGRWGGIF